MTAQILFIHAISPLHAGAGQSTGAIELPLARDRATGAPYLPGSSLKGSLRDVVPAEARVPLFGPETNAADEHAGTVIFGDANLLLLPVRSVSGTFAWACSPLLLARFARDWGALGAAGGLPQVPPAPGVGECLVGPTCCLRVGQATAERVVFEDLDLSPVLSHESAAWATWLGTRIFPDDLAWQGLFTKRLCIVHDDVMAHLWTHATDVVARVALEDDAKVVRKGGLWHEENLPVETILNAFLEGAPNARAGCDDPMSRLREVLPQHLQLGGKANVGRGRCRLILGGA